MFKQLIYTRRNFILIHPLKTLIGRKINSGRLLKS